MSSPSIDNILTELNPFGRVQITYLLVSAYIQLFLPMTGQSINFLAATPDHHCRLRDGYLLNQSIPVVEKEGNELIYSQCEEYVNPASESNETEDCQNGWEYDDTFYGETIITEWNLVCGQNTAAEISQSVLQIGGMFGALLFGYLADRYGRRPSFMVAVTLYCLFGIAICFSPSFIVFKILRFFCGLSQMALWVSFSSAISEYMIPKYRNRAMTVPSIAWSVGLMLMALLGFLIRDWRFLQLAIVSPFIPLMVVMKFAPESLRWLLSKNKQTRAVDLVKRLAKINKCALPSSISYLQRETENETTSTSLSGNADSTLRVGNHREDISNGNDLTGREANNNISAISNTVSTHGNEQSKESGENGKNVKVKEENYMGEATELTNNERHGIWGLFRPPVLHITLVISIIRFSYTLVYYGFALSTGRLAGNPYLNFFYSALVEIPARILSPFFYKWARRTYLMSFALTACGLGLTSLVFVPNETKNGTDLDVLRTAISLLGKFFITLVLGGIMLITVEMFPTTVRNSGNGLTLSIGRIGGVTAPFMLYMDAFVPFFSSIAMAAMSLISALLVLTLPDTRKTAQPQTVADLRLIMKSRKQQPEDGHDNENTHL